MFVARALSPAAARISPTTTAAATALSAVVVAGTRRRGRGVVKPLGALAHNAPPDKPLQRAQRAAIFVGHKADGIADLLGAARAADPVNVILGVHREIVIHHMRDAVHVDAARGDVCRHQRPHGPRFEILQSANPLILRTVGMQRGRLDSLAFQRPGDAIRPVFGARENEHGIHFRVAHEMRQQRRFEMFRDFVNELGDSLGGVRAPPDLDQLGRLLELVGEGLDFLGKGRGKEQRLAFLGHRFDDAPDVREEAHVEHPVGFVEHKELQPGEIAKPLLHQVKQTSRRGDDEFHSGPEGFDLRALAHPAKDGGHAQRQVFGVGADVFLDLRGEFPRGGQNKGADARFADSAALFHQLGEHREHKRRRLAGTGLRDADEVVTLHDLRDGRRLDVRGFCVARFLEGFQNVGSETESAKWHKGFHDGAAREH